MENSVMSIDVSKPSVTILIAFACTVAVAPVAQPLRAQANQSGKRQSAQHDNNKENATDQPQANEAWKIDVVAFDKYLGELAANARVPTKEDLVKRITARPGDGGLNTEVMPITDGAGGLVDLKPAKGTVQFRVNEALKGKKVKWDFELAADAAGNYLGIMILQPKLGDAPDANKEPKTVPYLKSIIVKANNVEPLKAGDRVKLEGTIGDSSRNRGINAIISPSGPLAIYHLNAAPHTVFWVGLTKATVTGPDRKIAPARRQPNADVVKVAKALLRASLFDYDEETLTEIYAPKVQLLPGNKLFYEQYRLTEDRSVDKLGAVVERDKLLEAVAKSAERSSDIPKGLIGQVVDDFKIEQFEVAEGEFITEPNRPSESLDGKLRFLIKKGDVLLRVSVHGVFRFVQMRKADGKWRVVAEY
jgi:hypothetical protein